MIIRYNKRLYEGCGEWRHPQGAPFYILEAAEGFIVAPKAECEIVKEPEPTLANRWQDVTEECSVADSGNIWQGLLHNGKWIGYEQDRYRLRKVRVYSPYPTDPVDAFLVEKKL